MKSESLELLLAKHTILTHPAICPELKTLETTAIVPMWEELEAVLGKQSEPPFWACSWPGGQALARYVLDHPEVVRSTVVLDLGCGNGLGAMAAVMAGASKAIAADVDPVALWMARTNAGLNGFEIEIVGRDLLESAPQVPPVGVILAGDLFYERKLAERALPWLRSAAAAGAIVLLGDPGRAYLPSSGLEILESYEIPVLPEIESASLRKTQVYSMSAP